MISSISNINKVGMSMFQMLRKFHRNNADDGMACKERQHICIQSLWDMRRLVCWNNIMKISTLMSELCVLIVWKWKQNMSGCLNHKFLDTLVSVGTPLIMTVKHQDLVAPSSCWWESFSKVYNIEIDFSCNSYI